MNAIPVPLVLAGLFAVVLSLPLGLYALLTRKQRAKMREVREGARERGWRFHIRHWQGNPTAFRIDGRTRSALPWILTSGSTSGYDPGWTVVLAQRFPTLAGDVDFAIMPRAGAVSGPRTTFTNFSPEVESRIAALSGTVASALDFFGKAEDRPSGSSAFDQHYRIALLPQKFSRPVVDQVLADRLLRWPADAVAPHSILAWRDPFGFHFEARLPAPPNWPTVEYLQSLSEEIVARVPPAAPLAAPRGIADRVVARFLR